MRRFDHSSGSLGRLIDDDAGYWALTAHHAVEFVRSAPRPDERLPWPRELAAAQMLLDLYLFGQRVRSLRRTLIGRDTLDLYGIAELVWMALRLGAMSETFRLEQPSYEALCSSADQAEALLEARGRGARRGGEETARRADLRWRNQAFEIAVRLRAANKKTGDAKLGTLVWEQLGKNRPAEETVKKQIAAWVRSGKLPPSSSRRSSPEA